MTRWGASLLDGGLGVWASRTSSKISFRRHVGSAVTARRVIIIRRGYLGHPTAIVRPLTAVVCTLFYRFERPKASEREDE